MGRKAHVRRVLLSVLLVPLFHLFHLTPAGSTGFLFGGSRSDMIPLRRVSSRLRLQNAFRSHLIRKDLGGAVALSCSGSSVQTRNMTLVAFISDTKTENGIQLHELATAPNVAGNVVGLFGNSLEEFQSSGRKLEEIEVLVLSVFSGGRAEVISELWPHVKVKWIHCLSAGVDTLVPVLKTLPGALETPLTNAKGAFSRSLAEYSVAAMMYFNKQIPRLQANRASRTWEKFQMQELYGKTCGFVGFGDIAQTTAKLCRALGMRVLGWRNRRGLPGEELADAMFYAGDGPQAKEEVFKQSDFVICSLPGGEATYHACGAADFAVMKPSGVFLSLGRGTCVDEAALIEVLQKKKILGAALDVFEKEPLVAESPLWALDNVLLSSHNADLTPTYMNQTWEIFLENLQLFRSPEFSGFKNQVDKSYGY